MSVGFLVEMAMSDDKHATTDDRRKHDGVRVIIKGDQLDANTPQTPP